MRAPAIGTGRAVEVLHDRGPARPTGGDRWTGGSGYLIRSGLVLTAAHNVDYRRDLRDDEQLLVRTIEGDLLPARVLLIGDEPSWADLALLELSDTRFGEHLPPVTFARVDRDNPAPVSGGWAVGFPRFSEAGPFLPGDGRRETWLVFGHILHHLYHVLPGGKRRAVLSLEVTSSPPAWLTGSAWEGMSGAVVFAANAHDGEQAAVGVISRPGRERAAMTVVPVTAVADLAAAAEWWQQFGVSDSGALPIVRHRARAGAEVMAVLPDPGRSRAVLIGASAYSHLEDLPAVRNNLSGFRDVLVAPALGGLPADNCTVVAEPARPVDVYRALRQQATAAEDTLLVYFAGHGRTGSRNELWLCLPDTDPDELPYSAWPYDELRRVVADSRAAKKVVILDCCFSGRALADQAGDEETILGQVGIEGSYLLTATAANAVALAPPGEQYTAFTGTLLGLLNTGIPGGPELLTFGQIYPRLRYTLTSRQLPRPRQQGSDTIAHLALTRNLAYTGRRGTRGFNERFTAITAQLDHEMSAPRLAGVYAMADLADDWPENRQTCVDVLCGYLRRPYVRDPGQEAPEPERGAFRAIREIRHTVIQVITAHLKDGAAVSWQGLDFDFTGVVFDGGDFGGARFSGGQVSFGGARFSGGQVSFGGAEFSGGWVGFLGAEFSGGQVSFGGAEFSGGPVSFRGARLSGGQVGFADAVFSGGWVGFADAEFVGATVSFDGARFSGGQVDFARVRRWSHPPMFSQDGKPPVGVVLPVQSFKETRSQLKRG